MLEHEHARHALELKRLTLTPVHTLAFTLQRVCDIVSSPTQYEFFAEVPGAYNCRTFGLVEKHTHSSRILEAAVLKRVFPRSRNGKWSLVV